MGTSATRIRTTGLLDTIGVLAIVAGVIIGMLPTSAVPTADAASDWRNCNTAGAIADSGTGRLVFELQETGGSRSFTLDTQDGLLECRANGNVMEIRFVADVPDSSPFNEFEGMGVWGLLNVEGETSKDSPNWHKSCSETYGTPAGGDGQLSFAPTSGNGPDAANETKFDIQSADWFIPGKGGKGDCQFPPTTIKKVDAEGNGLTGAEFTLYRDAKIENGQVVPKSGEPTFTCTSDANGDCVFTDLTDDKYVVDETKVPAGYRKSSGLPREIEPQKDGPTFTFTDPRIPYTITVTPDGRNAVGNAHEFDVYLSDDIGGVAGARIDLSWSGVGNIDSISPAGPNSSSCTTDSTGHCAVVVNSSNVGSGTLTGTFETPYQNTSGSAPGNSTAGGSQTVATAPACDGFDYAWEFIYDDGHVDSGCSNTNNVTTGIHVNSLHVSCSDDFTGGTAKKSDLDGHLIVDYQIRGKKSCGNNATPPNPEPYPDISDDATKQWVGYEVEISPDDLNLLGDPHDFTVTAYEVDGAGNPDREIAAGVDLVVSWSGTPAGSTLDTTTCTTGDNGQCVFRVDSDTTTGTGTLQVDSVAGTPSGTDELLTVDFGDGEVAAAKTWREYRAILDDDSVNPVRTSHTFDVQVQYRDTPNDSWTDAGAGLTVDWDSDGVGFDDLGASTCDDATDADGRCTIVVFSEGDGDRTVTVTSVTGQLLPDGPADATWTFRDVAYEGQPDNADETATKTWETFGASIKPTAHNQVGEPHTFTVDVFRFDGSGSPVGVPDGTVVDVQLDWAPTDASNDLVENTCATAGTVDDQCTITVNTGVGGTVTATVLGLLDYEFDGGTQDVTFDAQPSAVKTWYEYRAWVEPDALNLVGDPHTFYVTAQQNSGDGWEPVPAGTVVGVTSTGLDAIDTDGCATGTGDDPRTLATETNVCTVIVNSGTPGSIEVTVETVAADDAVDSGLGDATVSQDDLEQGDSTSATKTWVEYFADIEPDEVALTGTTLTYYVTVTQDDGTGATPVPAGTQVEVSRRQPRHHAAGGRLRDHRHR